MARIRYKISIGKRYYFGNCRGYDRGYKIEILWYVLSTTETIKTMIRISTYISTAVAYTDIVISRGLL